jgi:uncharacterized membrane protein YfcA
MPTTGFRFVKAERIELKMVLGIAIGGIPAVFAAAFIVKEMPMVALRWCVVAVVLYAAVLLLRSAMQPAPQQESGIRLAQ